MNTTEIYKGIQIEIWNDTYGENPFQNWDGLMPTIYKSGRNSEDYSKGVINNYLAYDLLSYNQVLRHQKAIAEIFDIDLDYFKDYDFKPQEKVDEIRAEINGCTDFEKLADYCEKFKVPYLNTSSTGYSQGDYAELFICYTPEFEKLTGCTDYSKKSMQQTANIFGYWAWGDIYGFTIEETGHSCGGFYGYNHEESGLMETAKEEIEYYLKNKKEQRESKLKTLIKNKVPHGKRNQILEQV